MKLSRRRLLEAGGAAVGGAALASLGPRLGAENHGGIPRTQLESDPVPFYGLQQAGIATPPQRSLAFAALDATVDRTDGLRSLFSAWTSTAAALTRGESVRNDSGETAGLGPARLTLTFGLGPSIFDDRFDFGARRPDALVALPSFPGDELEPARSGGDICVQACADDPDVAFHAIRTLAATGRGAAVIRWMQNGFRSVASDGSRNLLGFRDGTNNLDRANDRLMKENVWVGSADDPSWMRGGTYMVIRRIRIRTEHWDSVSLDEQERTIGRHKRSGAPLGERSDRDSVDPRRLPSDSHVLQANPRQSGSGRERILRRSYSFSDGIDERFGELDAGLVFVCYQRDPRRQFISIQRRLASHDHLSEYIFHTGSGIFAIPPGIEPGGYVGQRLFERV